MTISRKTGGVLVCNFKDVPEWVNQIATDYGLANVLNEENPTFLRFPALNRPAGYEKSFFY